MTSTVPLLVVAGTGHRPDKIRIGDQNAYNPDVQDTLVEFARAILIDQQPDAVIAGMALGWDQALATAAIAEGLPLTAACPFQGFDARWPPASRHYFEWLLAQAHEVVYVSQPPYAPWKLQRRNEWMVDACTLLLSLWDGSPGGTANCNAYADRVHREVLQLWSDWTGFAAP